MVRTNSTHGSFEVPASGVPSTCTSWLIGTLPGCSGGGGGTTATNVAPPTAAPLTITGFAPSAGEVGAAIGLSFGQQSDFDHVENDLAEILAVAHAPLLEDRHDLH